MPPDLTPEHFRVATTVWLSHRQQACGGDTLCPVQGVWSGDNRLYGGQYPDTVRRRDTLQTLRPLTVVEGGGTVYPAVLTHDPFEVEGGSDVKPLALITVAGYVGSVWNIHATSWHRTVTRGSHASRRTLFVTTVVMLRDQAYCYLPKRQEYDKTR